MVTLNIPSLYIYSFKKSIEKDNSLTSENYYLLFNECIKHFTEFIDIVSNYKIPECFDYESSFAGLFDLEESKDAFNKCIEFCREEIKSLNYISTKVSEDEIILKNGYSKKEVFVLLREIGLFESKTFLNLPPKKRNFALSILLNSDIDYAKQLYNLNSIKYNEEGQNGIKEKSVNKVKNDLEKQK